MVTLKLFERTRFYIRDNRDTRCSAGRSDIEVGSWVNRSLDQQ